MMKRIVTVVMTVALLTLPTAAQYQGSDGTKADKWRDQNCIAKPTLNNSCTITIINTVILCTGTCQLISYDRPCGDCKNAYSGGCQSYTGRVAVVKTTSTLNCVIVMILGFIPVCTCPGMGTPVPSGTVACQCAT